MYPKSDNPGISIMPVDNRANISTPVTIDMTTGWIADSAGAKKSIADVCPTGGLTITNVHSLDGNCLLAVGKNLTFSSGLNVPSADIWDGTMLRSHNSTTAEGAAAYYAEHCPTLTING